VLRSPPGQHPACRPDQGERSRPLHLAGLVGDSPSSALPIRAELRYADGPACGPDRRGLVGQYITMNVLPGAKYRRPGVGLKSERLASWWTSRSCRPRQQRSRHKRRHSTDVAGGQFALIHVRPVQRVEANFDVRRLSPVRDRDPAEY